MIASLELPLMSVITNTQKIKDQDRLRKKEIKKNKRRRRRNQVEKYNVNNEQKHKGTLKANGNKGKEVREIARNKV